MAEKKQPELSLVKRLHDNPTAQRVLLLLTLIYVISPVDIIPDVIPWIGVIDDVGILLAEVVQYLLYMKNKKVAFESAQNNTSNQKEENK